MNINNDYVYKHRPLVKEILKLNVGEKKLVTLEKLDGVKAHYIYVACLRKGVKIMQKKLQNNEGYLFIRIR